MARHGLVILTRNSALLEGVKDGVCRGDFEQQLVRGDATDCLHSFEPRAGDGLLIEAGTVPAVGGGVLLAEVQQSSDATFRLFDWNRISTDGHPRELHPSQSLRSIHFDIGPVSPIRLDPCRCVSCHDEDLLESCDCFSLSRVNLHTSIRPLDEKLLTLWLVTSSRAGLTNENTGYDRSFIAGETVLIPAHSRGLH